MVALVVGDVREPAVPDIAPPGGPAFGGGLALLARQVVVIAEVLAGQPAQRVDRRLADRVLLVAEPLDQPLDAIAPARTVVPLAPLALAGAEVLGRKRGQRAPGMIAAAIGALDHSDQIRDRVDIAERDQRA